MKFTKYFMMALLFITQIGLAADKKDNSDKKEKAEKIVQKEVVKETQKEVVQEDEEYNDHDLEISFKQAKAMLRHIHSTADMGFPNYELAYSFFFSKLKNDDYKITYSDPKEILIKSLLIDTNGNIPKKIKAAFKKYSNE